MSRITRVITALSPAPKGHTSSRLGEAASLPPPALPDNSPIDPSSFRCHLNGATVESLGCKPHATSTAAVFRSDAGSSLPGEMPTNLPF